MVLVLVLLLVECFMMDAGRVAVAVHMIDYFECLNVEVKDEGLNQTYIDTLKVYGSVCVCCLKEVTY
jgi:hypothetical protein